MSASNAFETALLNHIFLNAAIANIGDASGLLGSATAGSLYISLHTADPGEAGSQSTSEATYTGYTRVAVARTAGGWTITGGTFSNSTAITFPACTGGSNTLTHFGIGTSNTGAGTLLMSGAFTSPSSLSVSTGITPAFQPGALTGTVD